ncbi:MAG: DUF2520 domain-containing protein [Bacteroidetes bacterium]|jgi:predicted short-subunit dehydrogenase-like oxidoreductase (DUF2520 family)|nr:DUF2520 domain-containing protein [Bacteroidota bacterium]
MERPSNDRPSVAIIGAGALGSVLARGLADVGYLVRAVLSRTEASAHRLAEDVDAPLAGTDLAQLPPDIPLVFCCVPDDAIAAVAHRLATAQSAWGGRIVAHTSGALTAGVLAPLKEQGAAVLSFHPLQTFQAESGPEVFQDIYVGVEGDVDAVDLGRRLARDLRARPVTLTAEAKMRYHLAAAMASNYLVTLMALVSEVLASAGMSRQKSLALVRPLVEGTWRNLQRHLPEDALTGPIARGDRATVQGHLDALTGHLPHLIPAYAVLGAETVRVAMRGGMLDAEDAQEVLDVLQAALDPSEKPPPADSPT